MATSLGFLSVLASIVAVGSGLTPAQWRAQSIYQVMTDRYARTDSSTSACSDLGNYCGGTWQGLTKNLDYIQQMGFTAIWISPVVKNPIASTQDGNSYHGYWAQDIYSLNPQFGTAADLKNLSAALHKRGMYLMVDVVPNHMGSISSRTTVDYSKFNPFNKQSYFHTPCTIYYNGNTTNTEQCWEGDDIVSLPDLRTEDSDVSTMWNTWITQLVKNYTIDGLRIDSAQQVDTAFWSGFQDAAGGIHTLGEVFNGDPNYICPYQKSLNGILNYANYYTVTQAFQSTSGSISNLVNGINQMKSTCKDVTLLGSFLENHDNARFPSLTQDTALIRTAIAFTMLADGIPIIYQGQEQRFSGSGTPSNREALWTSNYNKNADLYLHIRALNKIRSWAITKDATYLTYNAYPIQNDAKTIVMRKGFTGKQIIGVFSNSGSNAGSTSVTINASSNSGFTAGQKITEVLRCSSLTADSKGNLAVTVPNGLPSVLYPTSGLQGSGICGL